MIRRTPFVHFYRLPASRRVPLYQRLMAESNTLKVATKQARKLRRDRRRLPPQKSKTLHHSSNLDSSSNKCGLKKLKTNYFLPGLFITQPIMSMVVQRQLLQNILPFPSDHCTPSSIVSKIYKRYYILPMIILIDYEIYVFIYRSKSCKFNYQLW
jgi:hypothetical protein